MCSGCKVERRTLMYPLLLFKIFFYYCSSVEIFFKMHFVIHVYLD